ncbi:putative C-type lectin domain family 20 member A [Xyrichtys novacula]|uniref:C-type lectin domain family 20 member A n=1 Tax=Xyrichtys novacula TaxID=13765 RepID=A0AAV1GSJ3_XYRNO|nr:putative C-type lectin domain family 20 member A [Xyrichtys novacula]
MTKMFMVILVLLPLLPPAEAQLRTEMRTVDDVKVTWKDAQFLCRIDDEDLVSIKGERDNEKFYHTQGWIGLYRETSTSRWRWSRGGGIAEFLTWEDGKQTKHIN